MASEVDPTSSANNATTDINHRVNCFFQAGDNLLKQAKNYTKLPHFFHRRSLNKAQQGLGQAFESAIDAINQQDYSEEERRSLIVGLIIADRQTYVPQFNELTRTSFFSELPPDEVEGMIEGRFWSLDETPFTIDDPDDWSEAITNKYNADLKFDVNLMRDNTDPTKRELVKLGEAGLAYLAVAGTLTAVAILLGKSKSKRSEIKTSA